jgi:hypothetical protein
VIYDLCLAAGVSERDMRYIDSGEFDAFTAQYME